MIPTLLPGWYDVALKAIVFSGLLLGIVFLVAKILKSKELNAWVISEKYQFIASILIVVGLAGILAGLDSISSGLVGGANIYKYAIDYISSVQFNVATISAAIFSLSMTLGLLQKLTIGIVAISVQPFSGLSGITSSLDVMTQWLLLFGIAAELQKGILLFAQTTALNFILPIGVILRTLPFTRLIGGFLMAFAIGLAIVFPLTYAFADFNQSTMNNAVYAEMANKTATLQSNLDLNKLLDGGVSVDKTVEYAKNAVGYASYEVIGKQIDELRREMAEIAISLLLMPAIGIIITVLFIRQLTAILGSEINTKFIEGL